METTSIISTASIKWVYFQLIEKQPDSEEGADLNHLGTGESPVIVLPALATVTQYPGQPLFHASWHQES